jgi:hypothetical protein
MAVIQRDLVGETMKKMLGYFGRVLFGLFFLALSAPALAATADETAVLGLAHKFIDALNKNDTKAAGALHTASPTIIDDIPPHLFQGPTAFSDWLSADAVAIQKHALTEPSVKMFPKPKHVQIDGDTGYVVVSVVYSFKLAGKKVAPVHGIMTFACARDGADWKIAGWSWANMDK